MVVVWRIWTTCFRFKGLVCYLSDLTYILDDVNFVYTPSVTEVSSAFIKCVGCIKILKTFKKYQFCFSVYVPNKRWYSNVVCSNSCMM